ncbi:hypothetical protein K402DRAFT_391289 [Aulographum hederae CBS 113979]|uniref:Chitin biosynthesis protein n=1 Tax=Aulographum hederae CBS 113979 TaxID=1176131 RepID=A0A6G1H7U0_9PEZI|nr:hypothetical protein K402DRAFT_391289 [Aulographum hederae CBS 113979]
MLISLTVGKVDAGVAVLLTSDKRLIEFPSILLPPTISSGSIVDITVRRNHASEAASESAFSSLQQEILSGFGTQTPQAPVLKCRNVTQTSVVLEWEGLELGSSELRGLSLWRNGAKAGNIPNPTETRATKISGLAVATEYTFHLVLKTSAGTYTSQKLLVKTHKMTDLSGISVTPGLMPSATKEKLKETIDRIGARWVPETRIDTTHFVCVEGRGREWERAVEMNVPVVVPEWVEGCEREGRLVGVRGFYLGAERPRSSVPPEVQRNPERTVPQPQQAPVSASQQNVNGQLPPQEDDVPPPPPPKGDDAPEPVLPEYQASVEPAAPVTLEPLVAEKDTDSDDDEDEEETAEASVNASASKPPVPQVESEDDDEDDEDEEPEAKRPAAHKQDSSAGFDDVQL